MHIFPPQNIHEPLSQIEDEYLFGWDPTPGIISVWANREGLAIIWRREGEHVIYSREHFRPWLFATSLHDLHRLQFDLETTTLDPHRRRIFMVAVHDNHGLATVFEAPAPEDEESLISKLCVLIRERDPDVIENHNLFGFDLPFLDKRATGLGIPLILGKVDLYI